MKSRSSDTLNSESTKERIVRESAILFAHKGYAAVSMKELAAKVGVQPSAFYYHFEKKEALFEEIVNNIREMYLNYFKRLEKSMESATCFEDVLDRLFAELLEVYEIYVYYGITLVATEQFRDETARNTFNNDIMKVGIDYSKKMFDQCIERGWVKPFKTEIFAVCLMNNTIAGTIMRTHEDMKHVMAFEPSKMFAELKELMLNYVEIIK